MMDSNSATLPHDNSDAKNAFRKPSGDAANRNYRRRSPVEGSVSPDGSPQHEHSPSPNPLREESARASHHRSRKYDSREEERPYGKNHYGRSSGSFRHSDRQSSRGSYGHSRHDKHTDEDRYHERLYYRSGHESKSDPSRDESESRSKDYQRAGAKYSRDKYDRSNYRSKEKGRETYLEHQKHKDSSYDRSGSGRRHAPYDEVDRERGTRERDGHDERDSHRSCSDYRSDRAVSYSESRSRRDGSGSQRDSGKYRLKEAYKSEQKDLDGHNHSLEEKRKHDDSEISKDKDLSTTKIGEQFGNEAKESSGKKPKLFGVDKDDKYGIDDEKQTSNLKVSHESKADLGPPKTSGFDVANDVDTAKVAAMRAAELVNRNLVGAGCLTTDQKKKLLWGGKKSSTTEEAGHRWDTAMFSDRERQEKFNKLMSLSLYSCLWQIVGCERRSERGADIRRPRWRRLTSCREAEGTPAGSREAVHCRSPTKRWTHSWIRSLDIHPENFASFDICNVLEYHSSILWRSLSLVCFRPVWEFLYALALILVEPSLGICWKFLVRQRRVISMGFLIVIVSELLIQLVDQVN